MALVASLLYAFEHRLVNMLVAEKRLCTDCVTLNTSPQMGDEEEDEKGLVDKTEALYYMPGVIEGDIEETRQNTLKLWSRVVERRKVQVDRYRYQCLCASVHVYIWECSSTLYIVQVCRYISGSVLALSILCKCACIYLGVF